MGDSQSLPEEQTGPEPERQTRPEPERQNRPEPERQTRRQPERQSVPDAQPRTVPRKLVVVFESPIAEAIVRLAPELGFHSVLVEPDPARLQGAPRPRGDLYVHDLAAAGLDGHTDVVLSDHDRAEIGEVLQAALRAQTRWIGIVGNPRHEGPHVKALQALGVREEEIARVHRPIGLNIGSRTPAEIAVATLAGLIADRNGRPGGFVF